MKKNISFILMVMLFVMTACANGNGNSSSASSELGSENSTNQGAYIMKISIQITSDTDKSELTATLADNSSATAFYELLKKGPLTVKMVDYGNFEKYGPIGTSLPRNDTQITTEAGDIILYQGNQITIYYDTNSWNFTRLGKVVSKGSTTTITQAELKKILGNGDVTAVFEISK